MSTIAGSSTAFVDPGIYQRLGCGCIMHAHEIAPLGPCLCLVYAGDECALAHTTDDFMPLLVPAAQVLAMMETT